MQTSFWAVGCLSHIRFVVMVGSIMDNRAEKWIENLRGRSNQNVWGAASPFEAIRVDKASNLGDAVKCGITE